MPIGRSTLIFFDASCLIAATGSPTGGSAFLLNLCSQGYFQGVISQPVLLEAERNIRAKMGANALARFQNMLIEMRLLVAPMPTDEALGVRSIVGDKDYHVVAAAQVVGATFVLTLDKRLESRINETDFPLQALSPGDFIKTVLPTDPA